MLYGCAGQSNFCKLYEIGQQLHCSFGSVVSGKEELHVLYSLFDMHLYRVLSLFTTSLVWELETFYAERIVEVYTRIMGGGFYQVIISSNETPLYQRV